MRSILFENRTLKQTIFKNTFWLVVAEVVQKGVVFLIVVWLARHFGPVIYGQWAFALSFVMIFSVLADFGFSTLTIREIACDKSQASQYIDNTLVMKLILGLITLGLIVAVTQFLGKEVVVVKLIYFLGIYTVLNTFATFFQSIFRANEKMQYETICRGIQSVSLLGLVIFFILKGGSILTISYAYLGAALVSTIISLGAIWRYFSKFFLKIDVSICKEILNKAWPFALSIVAVSIYYRIDTIILGIFKENEAVGYYNAAYNIILLIIVGIGLLVTAIFPTLSKLYRNSIEKFKSNINIFFKVIFFSSFPLIVIVFFLSKPIINIVYGKKFTEFSPIILQILIWSVLILYNYAIFAIGLSASNKQKTYLKGTIFGAVFNTIANLIVIPNYSYYGAAITTVLTEVLVFSYMVYQFLGFNKMKLPINFIWKIVLASIGMFLVIFYLLQVKFNLIIALIIGFIIYILMVFLFKAFKRNLFSSIKDLILIK
jgi:O-antigen/teichoic acid export membrane protein